MKHFLQRLQYYAERILENPSTKTTFSLICTVLSTLLGQWNEAVGILFILIAMDLFTGVAKAVKRRVINSEKKISVKVGLALNAIESKALREGLSKVIEYGAAVFIAHMAGIQFGLPDARQFVIFWISFTELKSIIENLEDMGIFMPECITSIMDKIKKVLKSE